MDNTTFKFHNQRRANSLGSMSDSSLFESTRLSLPHAMLDDSDPTVTRLQQRVEELDINLQSAHQEVDKLLSENHTLKLELEKSKNLIEIYKKIEYNCHSTPISGRKRKRPKLSLLVHETSTSLPNTPPKHLLQYNEIQNNQLQIDKIIELQKEVDKLNKCLEENSAKKFKTTGVANELPEKNTKLVPVKYKSYKTKKMAKRARKLTKQIRKIQNKCNNAKKEVMNLKYKILELEKGNPVNTDDQVNTNDIINKNNITYTIRKDDTVRKEHVVVFSDKIGQGLATKLIDGVDKDIIVVNYCKPGAKSLQILDGFEEKTKFLSEGDTVAIVLSDYDHITTIKDRTQLTQKLEDIMYTKKRKFNLIISGMPYNGWKDRIIYNINRKLSQIASVTSNVKYVDTNSLEENIHKRKNYKNLKRQITELLVTSVRNKFKQTSSLRFIECTQNLEQQSSTNFPTTFQRTRTS